MADAQLFVILYTKEYAKVIVIRLKSQPATRQQFKIRFLYGRLNPISRK